MSEYIWPCPDSSRITSPFGLRKNPLTKKEQMHQGVDIGCASGRNIVAAKSGVVVTAGSAGGYGLCVLLDHGSGVVTRYAHCSKLLVSKEQHVDAGQPIAHVGSTGNSTGPHLHFEIKFNGTPKNPLDYISFGDKQSKQTPIESQNSESKEINKITVKSVTGTAGIYKYKALKTDQTYLDTGVEILIQNDQIYYPMITGDVTVVWERKSTPGKLTFDIIQDQTLNIQEGNPVRMQVNGKGMFYGFIFEISRSDHDKRTITCYDQLRYLKNKDTLIYNNKTYAELLKMIAKDYNLTTGTIEDTKYKIKSRIEDGTLLDILGNASDTTLMNTGNLYVLYDDFGKICLRHIKNMQLPILIDEDTAQDISYKSSIDSDTYNRIKLVNDNDKTGEREVTIAQDDKTQSQWGILQYYESVDNAGDTVMKEKAKVLLDYYNKKRRSLSIQGCFGDIRVRGGSMVIVKLDLTDIQIQNFMMVERVTHTFSNGEYYMDLSLSGIKGEFNA
ncbi:M23 family metallopeptidase [Anaerolentibacter hominis]|uniref:M23 family metallopeptidase n=1 Tax=Anaerolentibacter hominis TaxID=3079009 RepID=UPI0031B84217